MQEDKQKEELQHKKSHPQEDKKEAPESVSLPQEQYQQLKQEALRAKELEDKLLRLQADFENMRKRLQKEKQDFTRFANEGLIMELLNVLDDLERAVGLAESKHQDLPAFLKGVEMILAHLYQMLKENGLKPIEAVGKTFDPNLHEALMQVEDKNKPEHTIIEEMQKGYMLNDRVARTAKVKVSTKSISAPEIS